MALRDTAIRGYGGACYLLSRAALLCGIGFVGNIAVPRSIDHALTAPLHKAVAVNLVLLGVFAFQQGLMADPEFRRWWGRLMPEPVERATYVMFGSLALFLLYWQWRTMPMVVWDVAAPAGRLWLHAVFWLGWAIVVMEAIGIKRFDRFDAGPVYLVRREKLHGEKGLGARLPYLPARHPIMSGFVIAFWATPVMTAGHLLFATAATAYIVMFVRREEREERELRLRTALATAAIKELSGTAFPVLRQPTVYSRPSANGFERYEEFGA